MIQFEKIKVEFGKFVALPDFNLEIKEGEFFTLLGPSGCGKTTALRTLAGFYQPTSGRIMLGERDITHLPPHERGIGMVFQNYALFPTMSVYENIAFGLKVKRLNSSERDKLVREVAAQVELSDAQLQKGVAELSGGQQQRVAIARAVVMKPRIMLLDEPLSNLDAQLRAQLRGQLKALQTDFGMTTIYVTHDQDEALSMSDRIAVMKSGIIEQLGTPKEIYDASATQFVCQFIGSANYLPPQLCEQIARSQSGTLYPNEGAYIRIEKTLLEPIGQEEIGDIWVRDGRIYLRGRVIRRQYHGLHYNYEIQTNHCIVKALLNDSGYDVKQFENGEEVAISFSLSNIRQYENGSGALLSMHSSRGIASVGASSL